ncbi:MAG: ABC transporter ATP-binding protein [Bacteroidales bacterium]|nr:ABC transporter ATP-binding protein [Bacteroidales bacterium]MDD3152530.1 ABC transporter ATP-binding protein [Bacteroidales bacterium]MDD3913994.1 ABC transporter ATP-binding protein [Bacteroidales bacterium]MDD4633786.1 ABC transporter ATP-binding protein [Bacteroidales bacterium]
MIVVDNVCKSFKQTPALKDVSFVANDGELFGLIGPDGCGKTTLIRIMVTLILADKGVVTLNGLDVVKDYREIRKNIGYMPGKFSLYLDLSVDENIDFYAKVFGVSVSKNYYLIKDIYEQLAPFKNRRAGQLSGGMKQKLALCCALIHKPDLLFLDEPTTGVDAVSRKEFWDMIDKLRHDGMTIIASTPYMDEASRCDRIALMQNGTIMGEESPQNIISHFEKNVFAIQVDNVSETLQHLKEWEKTYLVYLFGDSIHLTPASNAVSENVISSYLISSKINVLSVEKVAPNIEDCYIHLNYKANK